MTETKENVCEALRVGNTERLKIQAQESSLRTRMCLYLHKQSILTTYVYFIVILMLVEVLKVVPASSFSKSWTAKHTMPSKNLSMAVILYDRKLPH